MTTAPAPSRPVGVTVVVALTYLVGVLDLVAGVVLVLQHGDAAAQDDSGLTGAAMLTAGIVTIVVAVFVILLAGALARGSSGARLIVTFVMVLRLLLGLWGFVAIHSTTRWESLSSAVVALVILLLLYSTPATEWFAGRKR